MKGTSLIYTILRKELGSKYRIELVYDVRAVEASPEGVVLVWNSGLNRDWFGIGGKYMKAEEDVSVFYGSTSRDNYEQFDKDLRQILENKVWNYRFVDNGTPTEITATDTFEAVWPYAYKFTAEESLSEGQYVAVTDTAGESKTGWILMLDTDGRYVLYTGRGIFYLVRLRGLRDESMRGRLLYRGVYTIHVSYIDSEVS